MAEILQKAKLVLVLSTMYKCL